VQAWPSAHATFLTGYGTEAISYIAGLLENGLVAPEDLWITQVCLWNAQLHGRVGLGVRVCGRWKISGSGNQAQFD
jgi:hypothetical protein